MHQKTQFAFCRPLSSISRLGPLFLLLVITISGCENTVKPPDNLSSSQASATSSSGLSSAVSQPTDLFAADSLWTCTVADSTYEMSARDTSLSVLSISIGGTAATAGAYDPGPVQFQAFMIFTRYGKHYKICPASDYGNILKIVRGDEIIMAGARKTSEHGELSMTIRQDEEYLYEEDFSTSMEPRIYMK